MVPVIAEAEFHYLSAKLGRPLGASALPGTGGFEMRNSSKVELTHRVVVASSADSSRRRTRCSDESVPGAMNCSSSGRPMLWAVFLPEMGRRTWATVAIDRPQPPTAATASVREG